MASCPTGTIRRKGYTRKGYTKKTGTHVKSARVPGACISDVGRPGKGLPGGEPGIGKLKEGELSKLGYSFGKTARSRHIALNAATRKHGALSIYRKLNALAVYTKRTSPKTAKKALADRNYLGKKHGYKSS
jgi:hypothetical protein